MTIYRVREDQLLDGLTEFLASQVFGAYRNHLLDATLKTLDANAQQARVQRIAALREAIVENQTRSKRLVRTLELAEEIDQEFIRDLNQRRAELRAERTRLEADLADAEDPGLVRRGTQSPGRAEPAGGKLVDRLAGGGDWTGPQRGHPAAGVGDGEPAATGVSRVQVIAYGREPARRTVVDQRR